MSPAPSKQIAIAIVEKGESGEHVLIGLRPQGAPLAGYWEFPGGKVKPEESFQAAAVRECWEETGLRVCVIDEYPAVMHEYSHATVHLRFFRCQLEELEETPVQGTFRWVRKSELSGYKFPEANARLLGTLRAQANEETIR